MKFRWWVTDDDIVICVLSVSMGQDFIWDSNSDRWDMSDDAWDLELRNKWDLYHEDNIHSKNIRLFDLVMAAKTGRLYIKDKLNSKQYSKFKQYFVSTILNR